MKIFTRLIPPFVKPSTRKFIQEARKIEGFSLFELLHGYVYARFPYFYIGVATGEHPLAKKLVPFLDRFNSRLVKERLGDRLPESAVTPVGDQVAGEVNFADTYHGKVVPLEPARRLVMVNEPVNLPDLEQVIPYKRARAIILDHPESIAVLDCPCRSARKDPCLPLDVCLIIGEPFASFIVEHHPQKARRITQQEAVQILEQEDRRGHVHHAFFKDAMLGRYYAICNCCACCCGAMQAQRSGTPMLASSGYVCQVDESLCIGCGDCNEYCQFGALEVTGFMNQVDQDKCMGCGVCVSKCEHGSLSLHRQARKGIPLEIGELLEAAQQAL